MTEGQIQDAIRLELGREPDLVLWRNNVGVAEQRTRDGRHRRVAYGVGGKGAADLLGIFRGRFVAVEIKTPTGRQSPEQLTFARLVESRGATYVVLRSVEDARLWLAAMRERYQ